MREPVLIGLGFGGNVGDSAAIIAAAVQEIERRGIAMLVQASSLWRTAPWGERDQPPFINACALFETRDEPRVLLAVLKEIETDLGRTPTRRWGPRVIDIDILFYGDEQIADPQLTIPHRDLFSRAFVLAPLAEIAGDRIIDGRRVREGLARADRTGLVTIEKGDAWLRRDKGETELWAR